MGPKPTLPRIKSKVYLFVLKGHRKVNLCEVTGGVFEGRFGVPRSFGLWPWRSMVRGEFHFTEGLLGADAAGVRIYSAIPSLFLGLFGDGVFWFFESQRSWAMWWSQRLGKGPRNMFAFFRVVLGYRSLWPLNRLWRSGVIFGVHFRHERIKIYLYISFHPNLSTEFIDRVHRSRCFCLFDTRRRWSVSLRSSSQRYQTLGFVPRSWDIDLDLGTLGFESKILGYRRSPWDLRTKS